MTTGAFSRNNGKLFSELKLVTDNFLSIYAAANCNMKFQKLAQQLDHQVPQHVYTCCYF